VLHEEIPTVSRGSRDTIHGRIKVTLRVTVDSLGNVVDETVEKPGPSKYFARVAANAARKWKFTPADGQKPQQWLIRFEFGRGDTTARAVQRT
jgi:TonB family protein